MCNSFKSVCAFGILAALLVTIFSGVANVASPVATTPPPKEVAYDHYIRLKILKVTKIESLEASRLLKLNVKRWYGKIEANSLKRNQQHETQEFSILFPAAPKANVKVGDIIDYRIVGYLASSH